MDLTALFNYHLFDILRFKYVMRLAEFETKLLGEAFLEARRIARRPLGRIALYDLDASESRAAPDHADVYLLTHKSGVALWEVWLPAPTRSFDAFRWIGWLDPEVDDGLIARLMACSRIGQPGDCWKSKLVGAVFSADHAARPTTSSRNDCRTPWLGSHSPAIPRSLVLSHISH
jgi:hypothetical protein